jgi:hypothetical protein
MLRPNGPSSGLQPDDGPLGVNMATVTTYVTLAVMATTVARGTSVTLVNQSNHGSPKNNGKVENFGVNLIAYDRVVRCT